MEGRANGEQEYPAGKGKGSTIVEDADTDHWFFNDGSVPAKVLVCDIVPAPQQETRQTSVPPRPAGTHARRRTEGKYPDSFYSESEIAASRSSHSPRPSENFSNRWMRFSETSTILP